MIPLLRVLLLFAVLRGERVTTTRAREMVQITRHLTGDLRRAVLVVCWLESSWGRWGTLLCGCGGRGANRDPRWQVGCAAGTLAHGLRVCGTWEGAFSRFHHGGPGCRSDVYGRGAVRRMEELRATETRATEPAPGRGTSFSGTR